MTLTATWLFCYFLGSCLVALLAYYTYTGRRPRGFPPGPPTVPVIGNLHQLPLTKPFLKFHEWSKSYGPILGLKFGPQNVVVLNDHKAVIELLEKRGAIYSSRPNNYIGNELLCPNDTHILLVPYGAAWRKLRKAVQALLNVTAVDRLLPVQDAEASQTLFQLLQEPQQCFRHIRRYSTAVILASVFGQRGATYESAKVQALYHAQEQFTKILAPGATPPVDAFPFLKFIPTFLAPWKSWAAAIRHEQRTLYHSLFDETQKKQQRNATPDCLLGKLIENQEKSGLTKEEIVYTGGILMEAGSDTTSSTLHSFVLAMIENPDILDKAKQELDRVCGISRSPSSQDIKGLPYLRAVMAETLRWRPVAPAGVPHLLIQDDWYDGYFLPKGTIVFANTWSIHQSSTEYESPEAFAPERFLDDKFGRKAGKAAISQPGEDHRRVTYAFGAGRRVCPGQNLAENSLMVNMAKMVWAFDISADNVGSPPDVSVDTGYSDGFVFGPKSFTANFKVRSPQHRAVIEEDYEKAKAVLAQYED